MSDETPNDLPGLPGVEDFDAFWETETETETPRTTRIMGDEVPLPRSLPLRFDMEARKLQRSKRPDDVRRLLGILVGPERIDTWAERGMDLEQFMVLLAWLPRVITGDQSVTLAQVRADVRAHLAGHIEGEARPT